MTVRVYLASVLHTLACLAKKLAVPQGRGYEPRRRQGLIDIRTVSPGSRELSGSPRRRAITATFAWQGNRPIFHVQRAQNERRAAAAPAERRAPDRQIDDGVVNGRLEPAAPRRRGVGQDSFQSFYASSIDAEYN